ncbi:MAG: TIGR03985 family CRISPR-associated protein [Gomphosphaeria aponina SAG 52.96 = DSM 107014]|uniref:TIGR03985 family CRISPR-associated protein n=1 Tax=Gomphosphaeria aponina SAG 52.96 = DSM 107014 TaxID=1521640 RepID=A0A941GX10_9CHRO|nr:TIGR03985 family CRISPR-associated protein [Gomphosphaeria aponina SAG 52.96 = DSM 107014]
MSQDLAQFPAMPKPEFLQSIIHGSLTEKSNFNKAIRSWVILSSLYLIEDDNKANFNIDESGFFQPAYWVKNVYFDTGKLDENEQPITYHLADFNKISTKEWLFNNNKEEEISWGEYFKSLYNIDEKKLNKLLDAPYPFDTKDNVKKESYERNIRNGFDTLAEKGWLQKTGTKNQTKYKKQPDEVWQKLINPVSSSTIITPSGETFTNELTTFFEKFNEPINNIQRFFVDVEYLVSSKKSARIQGLQNQLLEIWKKKSIPPVKLTYRSAKLYNDEVETIAIPICFYYIKRAPYLFAYGQTPIDEDKLSLYDYRIDKIISLEELTWKDNIIPPELKSHWEKEKIPTPETITYDMLAALGNDCYQPQKDMIIRFHRYFHNLYMEGTKRESLYTEINVNFVKNHIKIANIKPEEKQLLLDRVEANQNDIYCKVPYRLNDNNVIMRLRAWGYNVEVLLPFDLRKRLAEDAQKTWKLYNKYE